MFALIPRRLKVAVTGLMLFGSVTPQFAASIELKKVEIPWFQAVGIDYSPALQKLILSLNTPNYSPFAFASVGQNAVFEEFSYAGGLGVGQDGLELKLTVAKTTANGFIAGQLFAAAGPPGDILRVSPDGQSVELKWAVLKTSTGFVEPGQVRSLHLDTTGLFGYDLIIVTTSGRVWRVNANGVATLFKHIQISGTDVFLEGVITLPNNTTLYGGWAGKLLIGAETTVPARVFSISPDMTLTTHTVSIPGNAFLKVEDFDIATPGHDFYVVNFQGDPEPGLFRSPASNFASMQNALIVTSELDHSIFKISWVNNQPVAERIHFIADGVHGFEHATFAPISVIAPVVVSVRAPDPLASESDPSDSGRFRLERTGSTEEALTVNIGLTGTASSGDYWLDGLDTSTTVIFSEGQRQAFVDVFANSDLLSDPNETVILTIQNNSSSYTPNPTETSATVNIGSETGPSSIAILATDNAAIEGSFNHGTFTFYRAGNLSSPLTVTFTASGSATRGSSADYILQNLSANSIQFPANEAQVTVTLEADLDSVGELPFETATLQLITGSGYAIAATNSASVHIYDPPVVSIVAIDSTASESRAKQGVFKVSRTGNLQSSLIVTLDAPVPPGTALIGDDYILNPDFLSLPIVIPSNESEMFIRLIPVVDATAERAESVIISVLQDPFEIYSVDPNNSSAEMIIYDAGFVPVPVSYTVQAIGIPTYATSWDSSGYHINNRTTLINGNTVLTPRIVGDYRPDPNYYYQRAFRAFNGGIEYTLNPLLGNYSYAYGINDDNIVVGRTTYNNANIPDNPCKWSANGIQSLLGRLPGNGANDTAVAINSSGVIVGSCKNLATATNMHAVRWAAGSTTAGDMGSILGGQFSTSFAYGINDAGRVVGKSEINGPGSPYHAFMTVANQDIVANSDLGTMSSGNGNSEATAINNFDEVVGASDTSAGQYRAFFKERNTAANSGYLDLGVLTGGNRSIALGINSSGQVVGSSRTTSTGGNRAFVYFNKVDGMINLNTVPLVNGAGWVFTSAEEINNSGYIVGRGTRNGYPTAFVLSPNF